LLLESVPVSWLILFVFFNLIWLHDWLLLGRFCC
jgi:hypothetical protein